MDSDTGMVKIHGQLPPPPAIVAINSMTSDKVEIYCHIPPTGRTVPVEVTPFPVEYYVPDRGNVSKALRWIRLNLSGGLPCMQGVTPPQVACGGDA